MVEILKRTELEMSARLQLEQAQSHGKWLAMVVSIKDGELILSETTCDFPFCDFDKSMQMLRNALNRKLSLIPPEPLPYASHVRPELTDEEQKQLKEALRKHQNEGISNLQPMEVNEKSVQPVLLTNMLTREQKVEIYKELEGYNEIPKCVLTDAQKLEIYHEVARSMRPVRNDQILPSDYMNQIQKSGQEYGTQSNEEYLKLVQKVGDMIGQPTPQEIQTLETNGGKIPVALSEYAEDYLDRTPNYYTGPTD